MPDRYGLQQANPGQQTDYRLAESLSALRALTTAMDEQTEVASRARDAIKDSVGQLSGQLYLPPSVSGAAQTDTTELWRGRLTRRALFLTGAPQSR